MANLTRIKNNQITDLTVNASAKLQDYTVTSTKIANNLVYGSDLTVSGNLTVNGVTTTIDTVNTLIKDPIITLADGQVSGAPTVDIGVLGLRGSENSSFLGWNEGNTEFAAVLTSTTASNTTIAITQYGNFHANSITAGGNLSVAGNITGSANFTGNITAGNILTTGIASAGGNVTGGNLLTGGLVSATGNATAGNVLTSGVVSATATITGGNLETGGTASVTGNITGGNLLTGGLISATGNITGGNINFGSGIVSGTGNIYADTIFANISGNIDAAGSNTEIQFNTTGDLLGANANFTYDFATNLMTVNGGNIQSGNLLTGGLISATGNATAGNVLTGGLISATGNVTAGNVLTAGDIVNASANTQISMGTGSGIVGITSAANTTQFLPGGQVTLGGASRIQGGTFTGSYLTLGTSQTDLAQDRGGNVTVQLGSGGTIANTWTFAQSGALLAPGAVSAVGNVTGGNVLTGGLVSASGNIISATNVNTPNVVGATGLTLTTGSGDIVLNTAGNIDASGSYINNVLDPVQAQDAATKEYVDNAVSSGIHIHTPVLLESPTAVGGTYVQGGTTATVTDTVAGNTVVFSTAVSPQVNDQYWFTNSFNGIVGNTAYFVVSAPNTSAAVLSTTYNGAPVTNITGGTGLTEGVRINSGIGATLTNSGANATLVIDGVTTTANVRVLIYTEANAVHNGVYLVTEPGNATTAWQLTRSADTDTYIPDDVLGLDEGSYFYVQSGDSGAGESYVMTAPTGPFIIGYNNLTFTQFSASQVYTANTNAGLSLTGTVFSAKVDNDTTAFDGGGNIIVKAGANLVTPNIGSATGTSLSVTGDVTANTNISAVGNVIGGNVSTAGLVTATGNVTGGNINTVGLASITGNVIGGNITTVGLISATGDVTGGNVLTGGLVSATGNATAGNLLTSGLISATGNATAGNVLTSGIISSTGNITGGNLAVGTGNITGGNANLTGNVTASYFIGNISGNIDAAGSNTEIQFNGPGDILAANANFTYDFATNLMTVNGGNINTGNLSAIGNTVSGNLLTGGLISATGNVTGGNVNTGNISLSGNVISALNVTSNITGPNVIGTTSGTFGNIVISGDDITGTNGIVNINSAGADINFAVNGDTTANILFIDAGTGTASFGNSTQTTNAVVAFNATTSILLPTGTLGERPGTGVTGMVRFNTTNNSLEIYDNSEWTPVGATVFTVIADEQFSGDGSTVAFTLGSTQTTNSCIVSINGIVQIPGTAYSVSGVDPTCVLTFTEAPATGDLIDVRQITTTTTIDALANNSGNAEIKGSATAAAFELTGNIIPTTNELYTLGNNTNRFANIFLSGNTIVLGNIQLKQAAGNTFAVYQADGTTPANITGVDATSIQNGNSSIEVATANSNISVTVNNSPVITFAATGILNNMGNGVGNIGNASGYFDTVFAKATSAQYADLAEKYVADAAYDPGTVLSFGGNKEVTRSNKDADRAVAGVVSTNPSYIMNATLEAEHVAVVAFTGRVPTSVTGTVAKGDLMVSNGDGTARAEADPKSGAIIGKSLENFAGEAGVIEVVIGRF